MSLLIYSEITFLTLMESFKNAFRIWLDLVGRIFKLGGLFLEWAFSVVDNAFKLMVLLAGMVLFFPFTVLNFIARMFNFNYEEKFFREMERRADLMKMRNKNKGVPEGFVFKIPMSGLRSMTNSKGERILN